MKKIKPDKEVYALNVKFIEGKEITDCDGRMIHLYLSTRHTSVPMIVPGENSEAKLAGVDGIFSICSPKCGEKMRESLKKETETIKDVFDSTSA
jgi:hypothetical protein